MEFGPSLFEYCIGHFRWIVRLGPNCRRSMNSEKLL